MKILQRFRIRKDLYSHIVYFENEGPLEMSELSASIIEQLREEKNKEELIKIIRARYFDKDIELIIEETINTLKQLELLS